MVNYEHLREILDYDPSTGIFKWKKISKACNVRKNGDNAGGLHNGYNRGYITICIDGKRYNASRLAWLYMTGEWPKHQIDHINRVRNDNRWENLRDATCSLNARNKPVSKRNRLGVKGVRKTRGKKYEARISVNGKGKFLGHFTTIEEAAEAYNKAYDYEIKK